MKKVCQEVAAATEQAGKVAAEASERAAKVVAHASVQGAKAVAAGAEHATEAVIRASAKAAKAVEERAAQAVKAVEDAWDDLTPKQKKALIALGVAVVVHASAGHVTIPAEIASAVLVLLIAFAADPAPE